MNTLDRLYTGRTAHLVEQNAYYARVALCGRYPLVGEWSGAGSLAEVTRALHLPLCRQCAAKAPAKP